ncbi:MAG: hypothetical protein HYV02_05715 [Deltaproteobacteria bacterium]|nr:hypothetical protein [Deltaproteobacteria bacterium]
MTRDKFTQYPHIENIEEVTTLFEWPEVIATEKVHGSAMRIGWIDGVLRIGGRRLEFANLTPTSKEGQGFVAWVLDTGLGVRIWTAFEGHDALLFGEWHGSGTPEKGWPQIQKGIRYCQGNDFRLFDAKMDGQYVPQDALPALAARVGLRTMPILYRGRPDQAAFDGLIDTMSRVGEENGIVDPENTIEGIVIRPPVPMWDDKGNMLIAKYKVGKWAERASQQRHPKTPKKPREAAPPSATAFVEEFVTDMRLQHVLDQLREAGIPITMAAMGEVMKRMGQDIKREGARALEQTGLEWKTVSPLIVQQTKQLLMAYLKSSKS